MNGSREKLILFSSKAKGAVILPLLLFLFIKLNNHKQNLYNILLTIIQKILLKG
ncbi:hypothetical protein SPONL_1635 [uncultured Candidatus Thioglobus sp.]|nr:hypothetical protein SPONL_1635 [uncultured Candidatus Thioglobus sp.]